MQIKLKNITVIASPKMEHFDLHEDFGVAYLVEAGELAVFDLLSETSSKHDFAPSERELLASGFEMSEIKFQPNSTGKIIVSDGQKAALLEFSDWA